MLKVFLVEDERIMREGIKNNIDWEKEGFAFVGEASDGELAYPLIQKTRPNILITDIRMPFMDGLELSRLVKQELPGIKILILSGYDEFEYAKEAISIGITDYLVKPLSSAQLLEAVKRVAAQIKEEQRQREFVETFERERQENIQLEKQKFFQKLVSGQLPVSALLKEGRENEMDLAARRYNILLFQVFPDGRAEGYSEEQNQVTGDMEALVANMPEVLMIERGLEGWAFILKETGETALEEIEGKFSNTLITVVETRERLEYFGGIGEPVERLSELKRSFETASRAFAYRYLEKRNQIVKSGQEPEQQSGDRDLALGELNTERLDRRAVDRFLKTGLTGDAVHFLEEYLTSLGEKNIQSLMFRQYVIMDTYFAAARMLDELGISSGELAARCGDFQKMPEVFGSLEASRAYLQKILETAIALKNGQAQKKYSSLLKDARTYIEEHYDEEDISLNTVAASVNLSPSHFSTIFSQETGRTFIEYLTWVRMEKAKELLRSTAMKTVEIACAVGYKDPHYFSYLFKKTQNCTPREFRSGSQRKTEDKA